MPDGLLIIDKPAGLTSHDVVARVRRLLREKRVGHTGTLDPFATGVLVLLVGRATRLAQFLSGAEKEYEATVRLGFATDTGDLTGAARAHDGDPRPCVAIDEPEIEAALGRLRGEIEQVPPMYSAKKIGGRKLYELARAGEVVERAAVRVRVSVFELIRWEDGAALRPNSPNENATCDLKTRITCSAGTYVRSLAESLGERLRTGAHLAALRRTRAGEFSIRDALTLEELEQALEDGALARAIVSMDAALSFMPCVHLTVEEARRVRHGAAVPATGKVAASLDEGGQVRLRDEQGNLLAVGVYAKQEGTLRPRVMLAADGK